ncbi:MAG: hypothetical protein GC156_03910 [Actinomycetales bacterium]|nr:hypothetical protein [Actinomycetales bacterium]
MRTLVRAALAVGVAAGLGLVAAPAAHAADLGRMDFGCQGTADDIYGDLPVVGSGSNLTVIVNGEVGDTFTIDEDNSDDCLVLTASGQSVSTLADLGGFVSYGPDYGQLYDDPLRYSDSDTVQYVINGPGTFLIQALDDTYYTILVNGGASQGGPKDLSIWLQSVGRWAQTDECPEGYNPSWAQWPNDGQGGWVCDKYTYAYYPGVAVE